MFKFFRKKNVPVTIHDKIWLSENNKFEFLEAEYKKNDRLVFACWFDASFQKLEAFFSAHATQPLIMLAKEIRLPHLSGRPVIFCEHYPVYEKELAVFMDLQLKEVVICSSLDEPLFSLFGGEKITSLMKQLGMMDSESIEHPLISRSIRNAQEKIAKKLVIEYPASSQDAGSKKILPAETFIQTIFKRLYQKPNSSPHPIRAHFCWSLHPLSLKRGRSYSAFSGHRRVGANLYFLN